MSSVLTCILLSAPTLATATNPAVDPSAPAWQFALDLPESDADRARREHDRNMGVLVMVVTLGICGVILYYDRGGRSGRWLWRKLGGLGGRPCKKGQEGGKHYGPR